MEAFFVFHSVDESDLGRWQSGLYYADGTPKTSLAPVRQAFEDARAGIVARCPGLALTPKPVVRRSGSTIRVSTDLAATYVAQLFRLPGHLLTTLRGSLPGGGQAATLALKRPAAKGTYRVRLTVRAAMNAGPSAVVLVPLP